MSGPIDIIKKSFQIFFEKNNLIYFLKIYSPLIPFAIFFYFQDTYLNRFTQSLDLTSAEKLLAGSTWLVVLAILVGLAYLVISFWVNAAGIKGVAGVVGEGATDFRTTYKLALRVLWPYSLLSILLTVIISIGFFLLIIPGILFLVWYHFAAYELLTKEVGVGAAMKGSKQLVKGRFWPVFGRFIVFGIFQVLVSIFFGLIPSSLGGIIQPFFGALLILPYFLLYKELLAGS